MKKLAIINMCILIVFNGVYLLYLFVFDTEFVNQPIPLLIGNMIFYIGFVCGVVSLVFIVVSCRNSKIPLLIPIISTFLALLLIPEMFFVSLIHFGTQNDCHLYESVCSLVHIFTSLHSL